MSRWLVLCMALLLLAGCGGASDPMPQARRSDVSMSALQAGPTPFIELVTLQGSSLAAVSELRFTIAPKAGAVSRPLRASYSIEALIRRGRATAGGSQVILPVFGLYAGLTNRVTLEIVFADGSVQTLPLDITTANYSDPSGIHDQPTRRASRTAGASLGFDYIYVKSGRPGAPVVLDTDGEIRWVGNNPLITSAMSSIFADGAFFIGDQNSPTLFRLELDGTLTQTSLSVPDYTNFHHDIAPGRQGLLIEVDAFRGGVQNIESIFAEVSPNGMVLKEWDTAALLAAYMSSQGDDPSQFIRPGIDWIHSNSAIYDSRDDSIVVSSRENFVAKFDYASGALKWILGDPTKYWHTFPSLRAKALTLEAGGLYPIGQHSLSINAAGELILFNNGLRSFNQPAGAPTGADRTYSAVSAYTIDPVARTARESWRFDYGQIILSDICSSVYEAADRSLLVTYSVADDRTHSRLVGLDRNRSVVFDFQYDTVPCTTAWNAQPIAFHDLSIR